MAETADFVVVGAGAIGSSIAFHLARAGAGKVILLERNYVADGTTWHSAGMVGQLRTRPEIMTLIRYSAGLYQDLESSRPGALDWWPTGSLRLATTAIRLREISAMVALAQTLGIDARMISAAETAEIAPALSTGDLTGAAWIPSDGCVNPEKVALTLTREARAAGADIQTATSLTGITVSHDRVRELTTSRGRLSTPSVVLATGYRTPVNAALAGVFVPMLVSRQQILFTRGTKTPIDRFPNIREPDVALTIRPWTAGLAVGAYAKDPVWDRPESLPTTPRLLFDGAAERMAPVWEAAVRRMPELAECGFDRVIRGPEGVTPDGEVILGPSPVDGLWLAAGGSGHGIATAGGAGHAMATWLTSGHCPVDPTPFLLSRFPSHYQDDFAAMLRDTERHEVGHYELAEQLLSS